ncbi:TonB-dependent receptor domain-containing protein [Caulobacter sp. RL271]|uniref:TonB-dependent receptor n=1 Tax=Caulobacter segnis TaxID=88688 RepID=A0ABY4ZU12_9CAUL|nr:TonB-dependent receptor [Caulobacter segnis]USQ95502.1 TonB-dependent receptor [Caulobacter segnis]
MTLSRQTRRSLLLGCSLVPAVLALHGAAFAQEAAKADDDTNVGEIVVTASRIDRAGFEAPTPTVRVTAQDLSVGARPNIAAALNDLPQFRATTSPQTTGTNTGAGNAPVDLRGLGISRTLVLLDGRRFSGDNDLNLIPSILTKGVDVVTGGASAAWGSGAVAGVVNISIDRNFTGLKLGVEGGESSYHDAKQVRLEAAAGKTFADGRGHFVIGAEYLDNDGVIPKNSRPNIGRWATISNGAGRFVLAPNVGFSNAAYGGLIMSGVLKGMAFNPDGTLRVFNAGTVIGANSVGGEGPSNDDLSPLVTPQKRYATMASVTYDLTDKVKLTAELRRSRMWNNYIWFGDHNRGNLTIKSDNAFLPAAVKSALAAAGQTSFTMGRFNTEAYPTIDFERVSTQGTLALDGSFGDGWRWSAYYSHGENENNIDTPGFFLTQNYANAVDSVISPTTGQAVCRIALTTTTNCVPINLFGQGAPSAAALAYVTGTPSMRETSKLDVGGFSLRGEPFSLPAGPVSIAVGAEARKESVDRTVGALDTAKAFTSFSFSAMAGSYSVKEAFAEVLVPVIRDVPVFNKLEVNAAARVSDYNTTGSIWSWKLGATNEFFPGFRGRITKSRDIRSANLTELFTTSTTGYNTIVDQKTNSSVYVLTNGGGNANLTPETAKTFTTGFVYSPPALPGFNISVDYFDIDIDNVITTVSAQDIVTRCNNGNADMCSRVTRDGTGTISRIVSTYVNLANYKTDGVDAEISYATSFDRIIPNAPGRIRARWLMTWVNSLTTNDGVSKIEYVKSQGYSFGLGTPKTRMTGSLDWAGKVFSANIRARYISPGAYNSTVDLVNGHIKAYTYVDLGVQAKLPDVMGHGVELYANATNLFDKAPPVSSLYSPYYDVIGRYVTVGARMRF